MFIFEREREGERQRDRERTSREGAERKGDRGSEAGSALTVENLMQGSNS